MFACYRRDEAHNPEIYCAAISSVLSEYSIAVIDYVTDPRTGLPLDLKFLPSVAEVREACDRRAEQIRRMEKPKVYRENRSYVPPAKFPGSRANLFIGEALPQYQQVFEWSRQPGVDECDWRRGELNGRKGIWIALNIWENFHAIKRAATWKSMTDAELRAHYGRREADAERNNNV
jgi:hypothetical protein